MNRFINTFINTFNRRKNRRNIVVTGPPRSGTTLTCHLLNQLPDTVALNEPVRPYDYVDLPDHSTVCDSIEEFYGKMRRMALGRGRVVSKHIDGKVPDNGISQMRDDDGARIRLLQMGRIEVGKELAPDFYLVIKNPIMFTALLPTLAERFPCYAIIRNPLAVMASAGSMAGRPDKSRGDAGSPRDAPGKGQTKRRSVVGYFAKDLMSHLKAIDDPLEESLYRLSWAFERFRRELPESHIIRYEEIVSSGGKALSAIVPAARELDEPLSNMNLNETYDRDEMLRFGERLLESEGAYWHFYSRESVEELMAQIDRSHT